MRVVIAGDSWGAHSYERDYIHPDLKGFKWKEKKKYVLYPGPGDLLKEVLDVEIITTADHGYSNKEALDALEKIVTKELNKDSKDFFNIPVSMIVKRRSNNQPVDHLTIENIAMNKIGTEIWLECYVEDEQMIEKEPKVKKHLDESQNKFEKLADQMDKKITRKNNE